MLLLLMLLSLTAEYLHAGDVEGIRGLVHRAHGTSSTRATRGRVSHMCRLFIHTFLPLSGSHKQSWAGCVTLGHWATHSLKRDPTMSCQQIIASNHFLGSLSSDKTRIQPPPSALMPAIKTESPLHSSLSQLHFYGRNFQRSSSLNLPQFSTSPHPPLGPWWWKSAARVSSVLGGEQTGEQAGNRFPL